MRILVTGGAGFLGRALSHHLLNEGADVVILDNLSSPSPLGIPEGALLVEGDVVAPPAELRGPFDRVFHLASPASPPRYLRDPVGTLRTGAEGTRQMLSLAAEWGARFVFTSTSEVYGDPEVHPQTESYAGNVSLESSRACYDEGKRYAEAMIYAFLRTGRVRDARIARVFNTYGPGMDPADGRVVSNFLVQALSGEPLTIYGDGNQTRSFCYVDDLIKGLTLLADSDVEGPVNLGNPEELTMTALADLVADQVHDTGTVYHELPDGDPKVRCPDITRARETLGWHPEIGLREGIARTRTYFEQVI